MNIRFDFQGDNGQTQQVLADVSPTMRQAIHDAASGKLGADSVLAGFPSRPQGCTEAGGYVYRAGRISNVRDL